MRHVTDEEEAALACSWLDRLPLWLGASLWFLGQAALLVFALVSVGALLVLLVARA